MAHGKSSSQKVKTIIKKTISGAAAASLLAASGCAMPEKHSYRKTYSSPSRVAPKKTSKDTDKKQQTQPECPYDDLGDVPCFVTTTCVESLGLPDDCHDMTVLRRFRDTYLLKTESGRKAVQHYYRIAPPIVSAIHQSSDPDSECRDIYDELIRPCVELIEANRPEEAFAHYKNGVLALANKHGIEADM